MLIPHGAIVALADGEGLRLLRNAGDETRLQLTEVDRPALHAGGSDAGMRHHSGTANPDRRRLAEDGIAAAAAGWLNREVLAGRIQKLAVIATPKTLGELRLHYHKDLRATLVAELAEDLSRATVGHIEGALRAA